MKASVMILLASLVLALSGCVSHRGAAFDEYNTSGGTVSGNPSSPTFRPGMNPNDIRDPNALTLPSESRPVTPP